MADDSNAADRRVLVVDDEYFAADELAAEITKMGGVVLGPAPRVGAALDLLRSGVTPDAAVLDVRLDDHTSFSLADELAERGIPFVFVTGYESTDMPPRFRDRPRFGKPVRGPRLWRALFG